MYVMHVVMLVNKALKVKYHQTNFAETTGERIVA
jgi:hypothetical protein